jgi:hypothetical protein
MLDIQNRNDCNDIGAWLLLHLDDEVPDMDKAVVVINPSFIMLTL